MGRADKRVKLVRWTTCDPMGKFWSSYEWASNLWNEGRM